MKAAASYGVCHIRTELPVGGSGIYLRTARPVTERIDLRFRKRLLQMICVRIALADDKSCLVHDVFPVIGIHAINKVRCLAECLLLIGHRHSLKDAVIAAADLLRLILSKMHILRHLHVICKGIVTGYPVYDFRNYIFMYIYTCLCDDMADTMSYKHLDRNLRIRIKSVCLVNDGTCDTIRDLVRMHRIYLFKHIILPFLP